METPWNSVMNLISQKPSPSHYDNGMIATIGRPRDIFLGAPQFDYQQLHILPRFPIAYITMYQAMYQNLPWRFAIQTKIQEKYRRGLYVEYNFSSKCTKCGKEYKKRKPSKRCNAMVNEKICNGKLREPDYAEHKWAEDWINSVNLNSESLLDVLEMCHEDICMADEGYIIMRKEYLFDPTGKKQYSKIQEVVWGSAILMRPVVDPHSGTPGGVYLVCPGEHRNDQDVKIYRDKNPDPNPNVPTGSLYETNQNPPRCPKCGLQMEDVEFVAVFHERGQAEQFYIRGEVIHWHEYRKSHTITVPPALTLWVASSIITYKDAYIRDSYMKQRKPRGAVVVSTSAPEEFMNQWDSIMEKTKNDWHYMPVIPFEPEPGMSSSGAARIAWVDFMGTMMDLDYKEIREIYERQIYQWYGVANILANIESGPGGKGGTEARLIAGNRHVERSNHVDNHRPLYILSLELGLKDNRIKVMETEDRDTMKRLQVQTHKINNAEMLAMVGYKLEYDEELEDFVYTKNLVEQITSALSTVNSLLSIKQGQMQMTTGGAGGEPKMGSNPTSKPKVDSNEFSGSANSGDGFEKGAGDLWLTDEELGLEKAIGDPNMHTGNTAPTNPSVNISHPPGKEGKYFAPDGAGPFDSKQALGGYMRSRNKGGGEAKDGGGQQMGMPLSKDDYKLALKQLEKMDIYDPEVITAIRAIIDSMEDIPDGAITALGGPMGQSQKANEGGGNGGEKGSGNGPKE